MGASIHLLLIFTFAVAICTAGLMGRGIGSRGQQDGASRSRRSLQLDNPPVPLPDQDDAASQDGFIIEKDVGKAVQDTLYDRPRTNW